MNNNSKKNFSEPEIPFRMNGAIQIFESRSDLEVWRDFDRGEEKAFNYLFRMYTPLLMRYGCQMTYDQDLVKDCIQNLFIRLRRMRGKLGQVTRVKAYLYKSLQRDIMNHLQKKKPVELSEKESGFLMEVSFETKLIDAETDSIHKKQLNKALKFLTERQRQALLLLYVEGFSYKEVAELMELKDAKYARKLVYRALETLKSSFHSKTK